LAFQRNLLTIISNYQFNYSVLQCIIGNNHRTTKRRIYHKNGTLLNIIDGSCCWHRFTLVYSHDRFSLLNAQAPRRR